VNNDDDVKIQGRQPDLVIVDEAANASQPELSVEKAAEIAGFIWQQNQETMVAKYLLDNPTLRPEDIMVCQKVVLGKDGRAALVMWLQKKDMSFKSIENITASDNIELKQ